MFHLYMFLFSALLFYVLTPGILLTIPPKSSKTIVALVHALVFSTVWYFTHNLFWNATEGFVGTKTTKGLKRSEKKTFQRPEKRANIYNKMKS